MDYAWVSQSLWGGSGLVDVVLYKGFSIYEHCGTMQVLEAILDTNKCMEVLTFYTSFADSWKQLSRVRSCGNLRFRG